MGRWPDVSITEARRRKADAVSAIARGDDPWLKRAEVKRRRHGITLDQVFEQWMRIASTDNVTEGGHYDWSGTDHRLPVGLAT